MIILDKECLFEDLHCKNWGVGSHVFLSHFEHFAECSLPQNFEDVERTIAHSIFAIIKEALVVELMGNYYCRHRVILSSLS
jgi:hypothetical protein